MDQEKKTGSGAPSSDTTSALFVSARKKQLEQQEADRRAQEKEEKRQAAEAEVRRLEQEVETRKRQAEEDARQIAEDARAKKEAAAANPDSVLGAQQPAKGGGALPKLPFSKPEAKQAGGGVAVADKAPMDKKKLIIIGAAVAVVAVVAIIIAVVSGGGGGSGDLIAYNSSQKGISFSYPGGWVVDDAGADLVTLSSDNYGALIAFGDMTNDINALVASGSDIVSASEQVMTLIVEGMLGTVPADFQPSLQKSGDWVQGSAAFTCEIDGADCAVEIWLTVISDRMLMDLFIVQAKGNSKKATADYDVILDTVTVSPVAAANAPGESANTSAAAQSPANEPAPAGYQRFTSSNGLTMVCPEGWEVNDRDGNMKRSVTEISTGTANSFMYVANLADEAGGLSPEETYNLFMDRVFTLTKVDNSSISSSTAPQRSEGNGLVEYYQIIDYGVNLYLDVSIVYFNDEQGTVQGVFQVYSRDDSATMSAFQDAMMSIKAA